MEPIFKLKIITKIRLEPGTIYYCHDGSEVWMWHKIVAIDEDNSDMTITWIAERGESRLADPLSANLDIFKRELIKGEWKLVDLDDHRIPLGLIQGYVEDKD